MIRRFRSWLKRRERDDLLSYAAAHYALSLASGDTRRAARLEAVMAELKEGRDDGA